MMQKVIAVFVVRQATTVQIKLEWLDMQERNKWVLFHVPLVGIPLSLV
jgi:hypothetical protein